MNEQERNQNGYNGEITEESPSRSEYFSWINNTNEGSTEAQTLANLSFFAELNKKYGMREILTARAKVTAIRTEKNCVRNIPAAMRR